MECALLDLENAEGIIRQQSQDISAKDQKVQLAEDGYTTALVGRGGGGDVRMCAIFVWHYFLIYDECYKQDQSQIGAVSDSWKYCQL